MCLSPRAQRSGFSPEALGCDVAAFVVFSSASVSAELRPPTALPREARLVRRVEWLVREASTLPRLFGPVEPICSPIFAAAGVEPRPGVTGRPRSMSCGHRGTAIVECGHLGRSGRLASDRRGKHETRGLAAGRYGVLWGLQVPVQICLPGPRCPCKLERLCVSMANPNSKGLAESSSIAQASV